MDSRMPIRACHSSSVPNSANKMLPLLYSHNSPAHFPLPLGNEYLHKEHAILYQVHNSAVTVGPDRSTAIPTKEPSHLEHFLSFPARVTQKAVEASSVRLPDAISEASPSGDLFSGIFNSEYDCLTTATATDFLPQGNQESIALPEPRRLRSNNADFFPSSLSLQARWVAGMINEANSNQTLNNDTHSVDQNGSSQKPSVAPASMQANQTQFLAASVLHSSQSSEMTFLKAETDRQLTPSRVIDNEPDNSSHCDNQPTFNYTVLARFAIDGFAFNKIWVDKPEKCEYCDEEFANIISMSEHIKRSHGEKLPNKKICTEKLQCPYCEKVLMNATNLRRHVKIVHCMGETNTACSLCRVPFSSPLSVINHMRDAHGITPLSSRKAIRKTKKKNAHFFICENCGYCSKLKGNMTRHVKIRHQAFRKFFCECGKLFKTQHNLDSHRISKYCPVGKCRSFLLSSRNPVMNKKE